MAEAFVPRALKAPALFLALLLALSAVAKASGDAPQLWHPFPVATPCDIASYGTAARAAGTVGSGVTTAAAVSAAPSPLSPEAAIELAARSPRPSTTVSIGCSKIKDAAANAPGGAPVEITLSPGVEGRIETCVAQGFWGVRLVVNAGAGSWLVVRGSKLELAAFAIVGSVTNVTLVVEKNSRITVKAADKAADPTAIGPNAEVAIAAGAVADGAAGHEIDGFGVAITDRSQIAVTLEETQKSRKGVVVAGGVAMVGTDAVARRVVLVAASGVSVTATADNTIIGPAVAVLSVACDAASSTTGAVHGLAAIASDAVVTADGHQPAVSLIGGVGVNDKAQITVEGGASGVAIGSEISVTCLQGCQGAGVLGVSTGSNALAKATIGGNFVGLAVRSQVTVECTGADGNKMHGTGVLGVGANRGDASVTGSMAVAAVDCALTFIVGGTAANKDLSGVGVLGLGAVNRARGTVNGAFSAHAVGTTIDAEGIGGSDSDGAGTGFLGLGSHHASAASTVEGGAVISFVNSSARYVQHGFFHGTTVLGLGAAGGGRSTVRGGLLVEARQCRGMHIQSPLNKFSGSAVLGNAETSGDGGKSVIEDGGAFAACECDLVAVNVPIVLRGLACTGAPCDYTPSQAGSAKHRSCSGAPATAELDDAWVTCTAGGFASLLRLGPAGSDGGPRSASATRGTVTATATLSTPRTPSAVPERTPTRSTMHGATSRSLTVPDPPPTPAPGATTAAVTTLQPAGPVSTTAPPGPAIDPPPAPRTATASSSRTRSATVPPPLPARLAKRVPAVSPEVTAALQGSGTALAAATSLASPHGVATSGGAASAPARFGALKGLVMCVELQAPGLSALPVPALGGYVAGTSATTHEALVDLLPTAERVFAAGAAIAVLAAAGIGVLCKLPPEVESGTPLAIALTAATLPVGLFGPAVFDTAAQVITVAIFTAEPGVTTWRAVAAATAGVMLVVAVFALLAAAVAQHDPQADDAGKLPGLPAGRARLLGALMNLPEGEIYVPFGSRNIFFVELAVACAFCALCGLRLPHAVACEGRAWSAVALAALFMAYVTATRPLRTAALDQGFQLVLNALQLGAGAALAYGLHLRLAAGGGDGDDADPGGATAAGDWIGTIGLGAVSLQLLLMAAMFLAALFFSEPDGSDPAAGGASDKTPPETVAGDASDTPLLRLDGGAAFGHADEPEDDDVACSNPLARLSAPA